MPRDELQRMEEREAAEDDFERLEEPHHDGGLLCILYGDEDRFEDDEDDE